LTNKFTKLLLNYYFVKSYLEVLNWLNKQDIAELGKLSAEFGKLLA